MLAALASAIYYKNQFETLTTQNLAEQQTASERLNTIIALHGREVEGYEAKLKQLENTVASISSERDRLHYRAEALQRSIDTSSAIECKARVSELVDDIKRGAAVAEKCSVELGRKDAALKACVRLYEDVKDVYDPTN